MKNFVILSAGLSFGFGLAISGMTDPARVIGFLDVAGAWDPTLAFVMAGAVASYAAGMVISRKLGGGNGWFGARLPATAPPEFSRRLIVGAFVFGVGWALGGFCPGPALARLGALQVEALVFVCFMAIGMVLAQQVFKADA